MRIVSPFRDYYDGVQGLGFDPDLTYARCPKEIYLGSAPEVVQKAHAAYLEGVPDHLPLLGEGRWVAGRGVREVVVGFCGKLYLVYKVRGTMCASADDVVKALESWRDEKQARDTRYPAFYLSKEDRRRVTADIKHFNTAPFSMKDYRAETAWRAKLGGAHRGGQSVLTRESYAALVTPRQGKEVDPEVFYQLGAPLFIIQYDPDTYVARDQYGNPSYGADMLTTNACLRDVRFPVFADPATAYQEVSMYIGGVLPREAPEMANISDEDMRDKKGFDGQSFKNISPGERKARRRSNKAEKARKRAGGTP